jgi:hypothetical protein
VSIVLGGPNARFQRVHGDIVASYQYVNDERAMCLWPKHRKSGVTPFIVCDSSAWKYDEPKYLAQQAKVACDLWGFDSSHWYRIATIIHDGLEDLIRLPPAPEKIITGPSIGDASLILDGQKIAEREVRAGERG